MTLKLLEHQKLWIGHTHAEAIMALVLILSQIPREAWTDVSTFGDTISTLLSEFEDVKRK